jgi:starch-binding outer membrane protein, SusD/RagB family
VAGKSINGVVYAYPYKYKVRTGVYPYTEYNMVLRLAELYLIRAEARAQQGKLSEAITDLNRIRSRAGLSGLAPTLTQAQVLAAVVQERRIELLAEWGHRWSDLRRTGQADAVLETEKPGWQPGDAYYPIPLSELQRNPNMVQNPGY